MVFSLVGVGMCGRKGQVGWRTWGTMAPTGCMRGVNYDVTFAIQG